MGQRLALLIANDRYIDPALADLYAPREEARDLSSLLAEADVGSFDRTVLLENESKSAVERAIERMLRSAGPEDLLLFYFSGHGIRSRRGRLYLAVSNTELSGLASTAISASFIRELLDESDAASSVILLDCCYSGAFEGSPLKSTDDLQIDGELSAGNGRYVITATNSVERADDGRPGTEVTARLRSAFTETVIQGLSTGAADLTGRGRITPDDLWRYVRMELPKRAPAQSPCQFGRASDEVHIALSRDPHRQGRLRDPQKVRLGDLLGPLEPGGDVRLCAHDWRRRGLLTVPVGQAHRIDQPAGEPVWLDLSATEGHLLVVGRAGSGKTTLLRTIIGALALTHTDDEVALYCLESGGNWLGSMTGLPHIREVVGDDEVGRVGEILDELEQEVRRRKQFFRQHFLDSPASLRARRAGLGGGPYPDVFLVVDRWSDFERLPLDFASRVISLANTGLGYGLHVVVLERRWRAVPEELLDLPQCRIEFRLSQPTESVVNPDHAARLPANPPGWALHGRRIFRIALPDLARGDAEGDEDLDEPVADGVAVLVATVTDAWGLPQPVPLRRVAPRTLGEIRDDLLGPLGLTDPERVARTAAAGTPPGPDHLRVPVGTDENGDPVLLDLKESAHDGAGPHGLLIGATGSGKTELLRTIVVSLAVRHSPEQLNVVLLDVKGSAAFAPLERLPHTSAVITDLAEEPSRVDRLRDALTGELQRRQTLLRRAGSIGSRWEYECARVDGTRLPPLPALLLVCDDFVELLTVWPEFNEVFLTVGRLGRSLGVHLLLAGQRLDEARLRGLDAHLSYRIGMRTLSVSESRAVLGVPDAYELPSAPGHGFLKTGAASVTRFRTAYLSGPYRPPESAPGSTPDAPGSTPDAPAGDLAGPGGEASLLEVMVRRLAGLGPPAHRIWLPPLAAPPSLDSLLPLAAEPALGLRAPDWAGRGALSVPVGVVDVPREQRREPMLVDLGGAGGNVAIVGVPQSGKSTLLRTMLCALALTQTPREVQFFCLGFGGGGLRVLADLPHTAGVAARHDAEAVRRTVAEVTAIVDEREARFVQHDVDWVTSYRRRRAAGEFADDPFGDVFLVVDGWNALRQEYEELEQSIIAVAQRGLGFGVHVVLTANRWADLRLTLRELLGTKLELRLGDPADSEIDRRAAAGVPYATPGRGLTRNRLHFLAAVPRVDGVAGTGGLAEATAELVGGVAAVWPGDPTPRVRLLPRRLPADELARLVDPAAPGLPIGVNEAALAPVCLDLVAEPHLVVFGDAECGKTNLLRLIARSIARRYTPAQARLVIADYRRGLLGSVEGEHLLDYAPSNQVFAQGLGSVRSTMQGRLPGPDVNTAQLRDRSWWRGPEIFVLIDDYDLVASSGSNPVSALLDLLPQARDIGLHLIVTRRAGGAARALYEPVLHRLRELDSPGLLMSGDWSEGAIFGTLRPSPQPPGRGTLVRRRDGQQVIQTAWSEPPG